MGKSRAGNPEAGGHRFFIVDVFGQEKYSGNQLAVVLPAGKIDSGTMQRIAREFNFPETTFIIDRRARQGAYGVRIFTPFKEIPFAGHPCLGTAYVIRKLLAKRGADEIILDLQAGRIPVRFPSDGSDLLWMTQLSPVFGKTHDAKAFARVLGLKAKDFDARFPIQQVSTGFEWLLVPLTNLSAVKRAAIDMQAYRAYFAKSGSLPVFPFSPETYDPTNRINSRSFAPDFGVPEDPATGSANGCLAGYLAYHAYFGPGPVRVSVEQGYEMGRKSILHLDAESAPVREKGKKGEKGHKREKSKQAAAISVRVGGKVFEVAEGRLV
ncbi:MAG: PhzF family phenazine biosynthesis protein [Fibrobacteria bacterium]